jgi:gas vesicle protein
MSTVKKLMIGVAVGAILGILYAPAKGSETRRKLSRKGDDLKDRFNEFKETINNKFENFKEDVNEMAYQEMERIETETSSAGRQAWQS